MDLICFDIILKLKRKFESYSPQKPLQLYINSWAYEKIIVFTIYKKKIIGPKNNMKYKHFLIKDFKRLFL